MTARQRKIKKAAYDKARRNAIKNDPVRLAKVRAQRSAYFQATYDPVAAATERKKRMSEHVEYCRQPKYRTYKKEYDKQRRASVYGPFAEAYAALLELRKEIRKQMPNRFERYAQSGRMQWNPINQMRRRMKLYGRNYSNGGEFEGCLVVNA